MQKTLIIAAICLATAFAVAGTQTAPMPACVGNGDGYATVKGVCQVCHVSCKTCTGPLVSECATCYTPATLTSGACGCTTTGKSAIAASTGSTLGAHTCASALVDGTDQAKCNRLPGWTVGGTKFCGRCNDLCRDCTTDQTKDTCAKDVTQVDGTTLGVVGCWGAVAHAQSAAQAACAYALDKAYIHNSNQDFNQAVKTGASAAKGYFYTAAGTDTYTYTRCTAGCMTCTTAADCSACAANYTLTAPTTCACSGAFFVEVATATADEKCTACGTGASTCTSATVATACTDTSASLVTSSVDSSIIECIGATTSDGETSTASGTVSGSGSTTDGETSTTATGTDAAATSGVLITAASMLLAVILA